MTNPNYEQIRLGFVGDVIFDERTSRVRAALLVTDINTYPYEFRITNSIEPSTVQRILYGATYRKYLIEKIGQPLLEGIKEKPALIMVLDEALLDIRPYISCPAVYISRTKSSLTSNSSLTFLTHKDFQSEEKWATAMLSTIAKQRDLFEPFERLKQAIYETDRNRPEDRR